MRRINLPWGLLITAAGFALLSAGAAYLFALDFDGHFYRHCGIQAVGGAILGAGIWTFSERISYAANLNTSPFLRLLLPGLASAWLATISAGPFIEFAMGSGVWWADIASVGAYIVAGVLPLTGGVLFISGLQTLSAGRRGADSFRETLQSVAGMLLVGVMLIGIAAGAGIYLRAEVDQIVVELAPDRIRSSGWLEREQKIFAQALAGHTCDVMVAPIDTDGSAASLDRPARSLIGRYLAAEIEKQGLCVLDPTLVARALGPSARTHDPSRSLALAQSAGARWVVIAQATLSEDRRTFEITVQKFSREAGAKSRWAGGDAVGWGPFAFTDELPPELAFAASAAQVVAQLELAAGQQTNVAPTALASAAELPETLIALASDPGSATVRAERLQFLAATYQPGDLYGDHLWERSLIALRDNAPSEAIHVLRARAAIHLNRRPYALAELRGQTSIEAQSVLALAQGNFPQAQETASHITTPTAAITTWLDIENLRGRYGRSAGQAERRQALINAAPNYAAWLATPMSADEQASRATQRAVSQQLIALGVPVVDSPHYILRRLVTPATSMPQTIEEVVRTGAAIERTYRAFWLARGKDFRAQPASDRLAEWDVYDALFAANRVALMRAARTAGAHSAASLLDMNYALMPVFGGYPALETEIAIALHELDLAKPVVIDLVRQQRTARLARDIASWEGGRGRLVEMLATPFAPFDAVADDEPPRPWVAPFNAVRATSMPAAALDAARRSETSRLVRALSYTRSDFTLLERTYAALRSAGLNADAEQILALNRDRFAGHPARDRFLMRLAQQRGDIATRTDLLSQAVKAYPSDWKSRLLLAKTLLAVREFQNAQATLLAYPPFASAESASVPAPQAAAQAGEVLLWAGEPDLARPLYEIAAREPGGSVGSLWSAMRLAQLNGRWRDARDRAQRMHESLQANGALTNAAEISFVLNELETGWRLFYEAAKRFENIGPWSGAEQAHRMAQTPALDVIAFAKRWKSLSGSVETEAQIKGNFVFNVLLIDRATDPKTVAGVLSLFERSSDKTVAQLTVGYDAIKRGDFATATSRFRELAPAIRAGAAFALPYLTLSLGQTRAAADIPPLLASAGDDGVPAFYLLLARAYWRGFEGDADAALGALWESQIELAGLEPLSVPATFQLLEACEKLYEATRDERYRKLLLDLARRQQRAWPLAWAYSFEAKHATDARERQHALGTALYLNPQSEHLTGFSDAERTRAADWFDKNNPFKK